MFFHSCFSHYGLLHNSLLSSILLKNCKCTFKWRILTGLVLPDFSIQMGNSFRKLEEVANGDHVSLARFTVSLRQFCKIIIGYKYSCLLWHTLHCESPIGEKITYTVKAYLVTKLLLLSGRPCMMNHQTSDKVM